MMIMMKEMTGMMMMRRNCAMISNAFVFLLNVGSPATGSLQCPALLLQLLRHDDDHDEDDDEMGEGQLDSAV